MKIIVKAMPNRKEEKIEKLSQPALFNYSRSELPVYKISVKEPPMDDRANKAIINVLAKYFEVSPSRVTLLSGHTTKQKIFEIS